MPQKQSLTRSASSRRPAVPQETLLWCLIPGFAATCFCFAAVAQGQIVSRSQAAQLFQFPPETPAELVDAASIAAGLERPADARAFLRKLLDLNLSQPQLAALRSAVGSGAFLKLNEGAGLQPEAREVLLAVNAAARSSVLSESRLQELISQIGAGGTVARDAIVQILYAGDAAVPALLAVAPDSAAGPVADRILSNHGRRFRGGLAAALAGADDADRVRIIGWLATTADPQLVFDLQRWQFAPDADANVKAAATAAIVRLSGTRGAPESLEDSLDQLQAEIRERLRAAGQRFTLQDVPGLAARPESPADRAADLARAVQLASDSAQISPQDPEVQALLLTSRLAGTEPTLVSTVAERETSHLPALLWQVLGEAIEAGNSRAAIGALRLLRQQSDGGHGLEAAPADIRAAAVFPDPRVRLLMAKLVRAGAVSDLPSGSADRTLDAVRNGSLTPEAVVIDADSERGTVLTVALTDAGYAVRSERTGARGFDVAAGQLNCELILVHSNCIRWELSGTIANIRADGRTQQTPIVIYGSDHSTQGSLSLARRYSGIWVIGEPLGDMTLKDSLLLARVSSPLLTPTDRLALKVCAGQ